MEDLQPLPGQMWRVTGPSGHGICLGRGYWHILIRSAGEYTLTDTRAPEPVELAPGQPAGMGWAEQFDALAAAGGLQTTWAEEVHRYQVQGFARAAAAGDR